VTRAPVVWATRSDVAEMSKRTDVLLNSDAETLYRCGSVNICKYKKAEKFDRVSVRGITTHWRSRQDICRRRQRS